MSYRTSDGHARERGRIKHRFQSISRADEKETDHTEVPDDVPWHEEVPDEISSVHESSRDAQTEQERISIRETSHSRRPCGEDRDSSGKRRHAWALQLNAEDSTVETTPYSDEASLLSHNCCPWRTLLNTRRGIGCQDPRTWIYLRGDSWRESSDQERRPERTGHSDDRMLRGTLPCRRRCKDSEIQTNYKTGPNAVRNEEEQLASGSTAGIRKFYVSVITTFCIKVLIRQLTDEDDWHSTED